MEGDGSEFLMHLERNGVDAYLMKHPQLQK